MTMNRHEPFEELISASLHGDLTADERRRLDAHLDGCAQCRDTLAAFSDQRRMLAGLRHVAPPRDLGARVRAGVESASIPWWRKPTTIFTAVGGSLAAVAGALLALVVLNGTPSGPPVGQASPTPSIEAGAPTPSAPVVTSGRSRRHRRRPTPAPGDANAARRPRGHARDAGPDRRLTRAGSVRRVRPATPAGDEQSLTRGRGPDRRCRPRAEPPKARQRRSR